MSKKRFPRIRLTGLSMPRVIANSLLLSLIINAIYLVIESACAYVGFIPIPYVAWGGECRQDIGAYWCITHLYPMTSASEPYTPPKPVKDFSFLRVIIAFVFLAMILWIVLSIVNKHFKILLGVIATVAGLIAAVIGIRIAVKKYKDTPIELTSICVITSDIHQGVYNSLYYPGSAAYIVPAGTVGNKYGYGDKTVMENSIKLSDVTKKQLDELLKAAAAVCKNRNSNYKGDFAYRVKIVYKTRDGYGSTTFYGYDEFPQEWGRFVRTVNSLCGDDFLREDPQLVSFSYDWFSETFGIYDSDLPEGASVEGMFTWKRNWLKMEKICGLSDVGVLAPFDAEKNLDRYLSVLKD